MKQRKSELVIKVMKDKIITINKACEQEAAVSSSREEASKIWELQTGTIEQQKTDRLGRKKKPHNFSLLAHYNYDQVTLCIKLAVFFIIQNIHWNSNITEQTKNT